jgi:Mg-chelatase subunit ChlD
MGSLTASSGTNIKGGLHEATKVIDGRRCKNVVSAVILLSDGQDNYTLRSSSIAATLRSSPMAATLRSSPGAATDYNALVPSSLMRSDAGTSTPIHTFGFSVDHVRTRSARSHSHWKSR